MFLQENPIDPGLGYSFSPKQDPHCPGHPRLDIRISSSVSEHYFDPKEIQLTVLSSLDPGQPYQTEHLKIDHPWLRQPSYRVAPGPVIILGRKNYRVEAFSFGGTIEIVSSESQTTCTILSPVPIIEVDTVSHVVRALIDETEILLAHRRAEWGLDESEYEARLARVPVETFYAACLEHILIQIEHSPRRDVMDIQELIYLIEQERRRLIQAGLWPPKVPLIHEIL